jgi:hypothetical protein
LFVFGVAQQRSKANTQQLLLAAQIFFFAEQQQPSRQSKPLRRIIIGGVLLCAGSNAPPIRGWAAVGAAAPRGARKRARAPTPLCTFTGKLAPQPFLAAAAALLHHRHP